MNNKITKTEVENFVKQFKDGTPMNWKICHCCALIRNNELEFAIDYVGQGMNAILYNGDYDKKIDIKDLMESYRGINGKNNIKETTEFIIEKINKEI